MTPQPVVPPERDSVEALADVGDPPPVVSISDVHGYLEEARSALLAVGEHPDHDPVVETDAAGRLHWADNDYVLVVNGDLVDRGPHNAETVETVRRLAREAPDGRVRVTVGNHEMALLLPGVIRWHRWYSGQVGADERRRFYRNAADGLLVAAYGGHDNVYAHAGRPESYDPGTLNDRLAEAADRLLAVLGSDREATEQRAVAEEYDELFGTGGSTGRGPGAGIAWLDFEHMPPDAPPQVVGHTRHRTPTRKGNVVCQNVIRENRGSAGGEAALVETPGELVAISRDPDGDVSQRSLD